MRVIAPFLLATILFISGILTAMGQESRKNDKPASQTSEVRSSDSTTAASSEEKEKPSTVIYIVGGGKLQVDELRETSEGIWYKRGNVTTLLDRKKVVRIERPSTRENESPSAPQSSRTWTIADSAKVNTFFFTRFGRPLPTTAFGQSDLHDRWGLDHRQGIDVGLHPDSPEGMALIQFLRSENIPFLVFRTAIPGVATGPHIHIGNASHRIPPR